MGKMKPIRQGDVILIPCNEKPEGETQHEELTLAYGEATGHHHTLYNLHPGAMIREWKKNNKRYFEVNKHYSLRHQEHKEIVVPPGVYEIGIEREYDPFENVLKRVVD